MLHLITGLVLSKLLYRLFRRDQNLAEHANVAAIIAASLWLVLPQQIATVFYLIQRMTILAGLFAVAACWLYVLARECIENEIKSGWLLLPGVPVFMLLAILSKEIGLLVPLYCLLIELVYFRPGIEKPRPKIIAWGFRLGVIYPCVAAAAFLAFNPGYVLDGYIDREFTMPERAMTQIPVLADYFASTFFPMVRSAGIFNDDFPLVKSLEVSEWLLLLVAMIIITSAVRLRTRYPSFSAGIGLFFIGHLLESSIFSLEIYFAHRNYLPSMGLILAAFGLAGGLLKNHPDVAAGLKRALPALLLGIFAAYGFASYQRASLWSNNENLMTDAQVHHPTSSRLRSELLLAALYSKRVDLALQQADIAMQTSAPNEKRTIQLWRILAYCYAQSPVPVYELETLEKLPADRITIDTSTALAYVSAAAEVNACPDLDRKKFGELTAKWAINTIQPANSPWVWKTHLASARLFASGGNLEAGLEQARWAFTDSGYDFNIGLLAFQLANSLEQSKGAEDILTLLEANKELYSEKQQAELRTLRNFQAHATL